MIDYKVNTATDNAILIHFEKCENQFVPRLGKRVNLEAYAKKIFEAAITFEAWDKTELIAIIATYFNNKKLNIGFITNVSVLSNHENQGIATKLLNQVKNYAIDNEYRLLSLEVNEKNTNAISFYKKHSFKAVSQELDIITMQLSLK